MRGTKNLYKVVAVKLFGQIVHWEVFVNNVKAFIAVIEKKGGVKIVARFTRLRPNFKLIEAHINGVY